VSDGTAARLRPAVFPVVVVLLALVLSGLQLNQSSIARLEPGWASDPGLIVGHPRGIRTDEFHLSTPATIGSAQKGFPTHAWLGLNDINLDATSLGVPVADWTAVFQPQQWGMLTLGNGSTTALSIGFAWHWWFPVALGLIGVYLLLMSLRTSPLVASCLAVVLGLAPYVAWWSDSPGLTLGAITAAGALFVFALRARRITVAVGMAVAAAWAAVVGVLGLYPPWLVSVGLVVAVTVLGAARDRRVPVRRIALVAAAFAVPAGAVALLWRWQNAAAIAAIQGTYYPGQRHSLPGEGSWARLLSAPLNFFMSFNAGSLRNSGGQNLSETASVWFPLPVLVLIAIAIGLEIRGRRNASGEAAYRDGWYWTAAGASLGGLVLLTWAMAPLPGFIGHLGLSLIPGNRTYLAIGLTTVIVMHLGAGRLRLPGSWLAIGAVVALVASAVLVVAVAVSLVDITPLGLVVAVAVAVAFAGLTLTLVFGRRAGAGAAIGLAVISVASYCAVGPLYRGLGPLVSSPLARFVAARARAEGPTRWASLYYPAGAVIAASPSALISGMTYYPNPDVWMRLAPRQRRIWNNYLDILWYEDYRVQPAALSSQIQGTADLRIDVCNPQTAFLGIQYVVARVADQPTLSCFHRIAVLHDFGTELAVYRRWAP
jgi:hypothetical protein